MKTPASNRDDADSKRVKKYLIRRHRDPNGKDAEPTAFSAGAEAESLANVVADRYNLRKVRKGKGKGWTPIILVALRRTADEASFLAAVERQHAEEERAWAKRYEALLKKSSQRENGRKTPR